MDDTLLQIASLTARLNKAEKSLALKQEQYQEVCAELVVYEKMLRRIAADNLDLRVNTASLNREILDLRDNYYGHSQ